MNKDVFEGKWKQIRGEAKAWWGKLTDDDLERVVDLKFAPPMSIRSFFGNVLAWHAATHQGEVSALKGVQGVDGLVYPH